MDNHFYLRFTAKTFWTCICSRRLCWVANISRVPGWPTSVQKFNVNSKRQRGKSRLWTCLMVLLPSVIALIVLQLVTYCLSLYCAFPLPPLRFGSRTMWTLVQRHSAIETNLCLQDPHWTHQASLGDVDHSNARFLKRVHTQQKKCRLLVKMPCSYYKSIPVAQACYF